MKKLLVAFVALFVAVSAMAKGNGEVIPSKTTDAFIYENGVFTIKKAGDYNVTLYSPASKYGQVVKAFGYYYTDKASDKIILDTKLTGNQTLTLKDVPEGAKVGFYLDTQKSTDEVGTMWSEAGLNSDNNERFFLTADNKGEYFTFGDTKWGDGGVLAFKFSVGQINEEGGTPSGQPLPGVLTTCAIIAACGAGAKALRRKK